MAYISRSMTTGGRAAATKREGNTRYFERKGNCFTDVSYETEELESFVKTMKTKGLGYPASSLGKLMVGDTLNHRDVTNIKRLLALGYAKISEGTLLFNPNPEIPEDVRITMLRKIEKNIVWKRIIRKNTFTCNEALIKQEQSFHMIVLLILYGFMKKVGPNKYGWCLPLEERQNLHDVLSGKGREGDSRETIRSRITDIEAKISKETSSGNQAIAQALKGARNRYIFLFFSLSMLGAKAKSPFSMKPLVNHILTYAGKNNIKVDAYTLPNEMGAAAVWFCKQGVAMKVSPGRFRWELSKINGILNSIEGTTRLEKARDERNRR